MQHRAISSKLRYVILTQSYLEWQHWESISFLFNCCSFGKLCRQTDYFLGFNWNDSLINWIPCERAIPHGAIGVPRHHDARQDWKTSRDSYILIEAIISCRWMILIAIVYLCMKVSACRGRCETNLFYTCIVILCTSVRADDSKHVWTQTTAYL